MAWYDDEEDSYDFGGAFDIPVDDSFDFTNYLPDVDFGDVLGGAIGTEGGIDFSQYIPSFDFELPAGAIGTEGGIDFSQYLPSFDFELPGGAIGTEGGIDFSQYAPSFDEELPGGAVGDIFSSYDVENQPGGFYGETDRATYDPFANMTTVTDSDTGTRYLSEEGNVTYRPDGVIEVERPDGSIGFYHSEGDTGRYVQYEDPNTPGALVSTYEQTGGTGPTRGVFYSGEGKDATVADYSDVFGQPTDTVRTSMTKQGLLGDKSSTTTMSGGKTTTEDTADTNTITKIINQLTGGNASNKDVALYATLLGGILGLLGGKGGGGAAPGYTGGIPKYTATRGTPTSPTAGGRRAGGAGLGSLTGGVTYTKAAQGGLMDVMAGQPNESVLMMAKGGETGRYLRGATDGMADKIYTDIDGQQPARLSHGEFVIPADVVSHLGNGNSDAGAKELHDMMNRVRKARTGTTKQGKEIKPRKHMAA